MHTLIRDTNGQAAFKHQSGELSHVTIEIASLGSKRVRVVNLPPEVENDFLRNTLAPYGNVLHIQNEKWSKAYRYVVDNGVRQVTMCLQRHIPSHFTVTGQRVLLSYEGQPATCYGCGAEDHMYQGCPARNRPKTVKDRTTKPSYADILMTSTVPPSGSQTGAITPTTAPSSDRSAEPQGRTGTIGEAESEPLVAPTTDLANAPIPVASLPPTKSAPGNKDTALWADMVDEQGQMGITHQGDNQQTGSHDHPTATDLPPNDVEVTERESTEETVT
jgi:hypothetical protein